MTTVTYAGTPPATQIHPDFAVDGGEDYDNFQSIQILAGQEYIATVKAMDNTEALAEKTRLDGVFDIAYPDKLPSISSNKAKWKAQQSVTKDQIAATT